MFVCCPAPSSPSPLHSILRPDRRCGGSWPWRAAYWGRKWLVGEHVCCRQARHTCSSLLSCEAVQGKSDLVAYCFFSCSVGCSQSACRCRKVHEYLPAHHIHSTAAKAASSALPDRHADGMPQSTMACYAGNASSSTSRSLFFVPIDRYAETSMRGRGLLGEQRHVGAAGCSSICNVHMLVLFSTSIGCSTP